MDIIEQIKKLAGEAADVVLQKFDAKRIGAQAERLGLFQAYMRATPSYTFLDLLRERRALESGLTNGELFAEIAARGLRYIPSFDEGYGRAEVESKVLAEATRHRACAVALELEDAGNALVALAEKLRARA